MIIAQHSLSDALCIVVQESGNCINAAFIEIFAKVYVQRKIQKLQQKVLHIIKYMRKLY